MAILLDELAVIPNMMAPPMVLPIKSLRCILLFLLNIIDQAAHERILELKANIIPIDPSG